MSLNQWHIMTYETFWNCQKDARELSVNESLRLSVTLMTISNVTRSDLLSKILFKNMALNIRKHFRLFLRKILLELLWH